MKSFVSIYYLLEREDENTITPFKKGGYYGK